MKRILCSTALRYGSISTSFSIQYDSLQFGVDQFIGRNSGCDGNFFKLAVTFLLGKEVFAVSSRSNQNHGCKPDPPEGNKLR